MLRTAIQFVLALLSCILCALALEGCKDQGVGDPCVPEAIPCDREGNCGYQASEIYLEVASTQCQTRVCIVHKLDNGSDTVASDPQRPCDAKGEPEGCIDASSLEASVYCTCRCRSEGGSNDCACPSGFSCKEIATSSLVPSGIAGDYCVKD